MTGHHKFAERAPGSAERGEAYIVSAALTAARARPDPLAAGPARAMREYQARATTRYRLIDAQGRYVHMEDFMRLTDDPRTAWIGFRRQLETVLKRHPNLRSMRIVRVPPPAQPPPRGIPT